MLGGGMGGLVFISLFLCIIYRNLKHSMIIKKPSMDPGSVYRRFLPLMTCVWVGWVADHCSALAYQKVPILPFGSPLSAAHFSSFGLVNSFSNSRCYKFSACICRSKALGPSYAETLKYSIERLKALGSPWWVA